MDFKIGQEVAQLIKAVRAPEISDGKDLLKKLF